ncbi:malto-oligosyltrehalose trehalohydrolase [Jiangella alkaliphila]|uniref:Malto-oligosyltrehalose trehalohydrolase n=1 Tax=Jiangella alkaliphila TaxID=419479 RepID=A0A1H2KQV1_9ACTN|nr:malto-oligosyltrehalose trehalohydrolase [Jiangella alkaliphila]SDU70905.1 maltooligosyl trehalose hydrolase [Jiangella alkaliphila]
MTTFLVWAPAARRVQLRAGRRTATAVRAPGGWWTAHAPAAPGTDYGWQLDDSPEVLPDPRAAWLPLGVNGRARVYDHAAFRWTDRGWAGRPLAGAVLYELHIGTFSPEGTFDGAVGRLDHLVALGVTHVEVLPVNALGGDWNWGYDGVGWYAVHEPLGGPDGFKRFVDACHARGLAVVLDVVYNHVGPSGNHLPRFGPYLKADAGTAWGDVVNLGEPAVRRFVVDNALMWLRDYHLDGLRLDAVHALADPLAGHGHPHLLAELSAAVEKLAGELGRPLPLIAESDLNDPIMIEPRTAGGYGLDAQWDDDVHHALHALLTGEGQGYYADFGSLTVLAKVVRDAFLHDGRFSSFRGRPHGHPVDRARTSGHRFVVCLQNHDQVGNRAAGERLTELASPARLRLGVVLLLSLPFTPMLWMGEEWAAATRWPYFTSHPDPVLAAAIGPGRLEEFRRHGWDTSAMIDPQDPAAFRTARLDWTEPARPGHAEMLDLYRRMIALRAAEPELRDGDLTAVASGFDEDAGWFVLHRGALRVVVNLAAEPRRVPLSGTAGDVLLATGPLTPAADGATVELGAESAAVLRTRSATP